MSWVAHRFGRVEFQTSNICFDFFKCACLKEKKQMFKIRHVQIDELVRTKQMSSAPEMKFRYIGILFEPISQVGFNLSLDEI